jgi:hypothetical protein
LQVEKSLTKQSLKEASLQPGFSFDAEHSLIPDCARDDDVTLTIISPTELPGDDEEATPL